MEYNSLESRIFATFLLQSAPKFVPDTESGVQESTQRQLYDWTRNAYTLITESPQIIVKSLNEDDAHPNQFNAASYGKPKLKPTMRKVLKIMNDLMAAVWDMAIAGELDNKKLILSEDYKISKKFIVPLKSIGIRINDKVVTSEEFTEIFIAMKSLSNYNNGFERFIRCVYRQRVEGYDRYIQAVCC